MKFNACACFLIVVFCFVLTSSVYAAPSISNISDNRAVDYVPSNQVPKYEKFEITFDVATAATKPIFPYDANPPAGVTANEGITVDALFSSDNWQTSYTVPAFYFQEYEEDTANPPANPYRVLQKGNKEWFYPTNQFYWKVRFAPNTTGTWQYKLRATDSGGTAETQPASFMVTTSNNKGFLKVSPSDARYFEFDNGDFFPGLGYNMNYSEVAWANPIKDNIANFQAMKANGIQYARIWLSQWAIYGARWTPWRSHLTAGDGYFPHDAFNLNNAAPGSEASIKIAADTSLPATDLNNNRCMLWGWSAYELAVKRNTQYQIEIKYKTGATNLVPVDDTKPFGLVAKLGGWLWGGQDGFCYDPVNGTLNGRIISNHSSANTQGQWQILTGQPFTITNKDTLGNLYLALENVANGQTFIDSVTVTEVATGNQIVPKPSMNHHLQIDQRNAFSFDKMLELAEDNDIYLRPVLLEKQDWFLERMDHATGQLQSIRDVNYFYGDWRNMTRARWLETAWWRYVQARWGYSTSIHSWELLNEGDPFNGNHHILTDELGKYMHCRAFGLTVGSGDGQQCSYNHPNDHLVSTSAWNSFPQTQFWANAKYPNVDFADVHKYMDGDVNVDAAGNTDFNSRLYGALESGGAGKPVIRGETALIDDAKQDPNRVWLHNLVWGQINSGGMYDSSYWWRSHIYATNGSYDYRNKFKDFYDFISTIPLNNGNYVDIAATSTEIDSGAIRVLGQKDLTNKNAHLWIQNRKHVWCAVASIPGCTTVWDNSRLNGTVTISGFTASTQYPIEWWQFDTTGTLTKVANSISSNSAGEIVLDLTALAPTITDTGIKIGDYSALPSPSPTGGATTPTPTSVPGDTNNDRHVNLLDLSVVLSNFGLSSGGTQDKGDFDGNGAVNLSDLAVLLANFGS